LVEQNIYQQLLGERLGGLCIARIEDAIPGVLPPSAL
jgi:hypothetical protein